MNWREIDVLVRALRERLGDLSSAHAYLERLIAPERPRFPARYLKAEWALKLRGKSQESWVVFSVRPRRTYLAFYPARALRLAPEATRSPFDLEVVRHLKDSRLLSIETPPRERIVLFWFSGDDGDLGLVVVLIPAAPEALLITRDGRILTSTKKGRSGKFEIPEGAQAPAEPPIRPELSKPEDFHLAIERELEIEAFELRLLAAEKALKQLAKGARDRKRQSQTSVDEARAEPDWKRFGELMKATLPNAPEPERGKKGLVRKIKDFATDEVVEVPADPKFSASQQSERFFQLARRKARRLEEAQIRLDGAIEILARADRELAGLPKPCDWEGLEKLERASGLQIEAPGPKVGQRGGKKSKGTWLGKAFRSKDGLPIWVGRSRDENLELTFKHARGNDLWMHVRGRPGAHVVIPLPSGKSPPLETLLDAAVLALHYSGGEKWGKTEVDYTYKKHVKRIRDSTEASYTHNKTLMVAPDAARLKRLLDGSQ